MNFTIDEHEKFDEDVLMEEIPTMSSDILSALYVVAELSATLFHRFFFRPLFGLLLK